MINFDNIKNLKIYKRFFKQKKNLLSIKHKFRTFGNICLVFGLILKLVILNINWINTLH